MAISKITDNSLNITDLTFADDLTLGSDSAVLNFGADNDVTLTHVADTGLTLNTKLWKLKSLIKWGYFFGVTKKPTNYRNDCET